MIALWAAKFKSQLITGGVVVAILAGGLVYINSLKEDIEDRDQKITNVTGERDRAIVDLARTEQVKEEERKARVDAQKELEIYLNELKRIQDEKEKLDACIAAGTCGYSVRIVQQKATACTSDSVSTTGSGTDPTTTTLARLDENVQQDISILKRDIETVNKMYALCLADLKSKSAK